MRIQQISNYKRNYSKTNLYKNRQSTPSFKGVQEIEDSYNKKIKNLNWWSRNFTNKKENLNLQKNAEILGYAKAQEAERAKWQEYYETQIKAYENAQKNNTSQEEIAELKTKAKEAENILKIQTELMKVKQNTGWDRIAGYDSEKAILTSEFIQAVGLEKAGNEVSIPNGILFFGPTGNGKTTFAKAFAEQAQCPLIEVDSIDEDDFLESLDNALKEAKNNFKKDKLRSIILIDEFEKYGLDGEKGGNKKNIANLKSIMQASSDKYKATFFLTTNNPQDIDSILLADSRVPVRVFFDPPDRINAKRVFEYYIKEKTTNFINTNNIVNELFNNQEAGTYSNSRIKTIVEKCFKEATNEKRVMTEGDLIQKIKETLPDITKNHLEKYKADVKAIIGNIK